MTRWQREVALKWVRTISFFHVSRSAAESRASTGVVSEAEVKVLPGSRASLSPKLNGKQSTFAEQDKVTSPARTCWGKTAPWDSGMPTLAVGMMDCDSLACHSLSLPDPLAMVA